MDICRYALKNMNGAQGRRLLHGRGKSLPGWEHVNMDFFPPVLMVYLFDACAEAQALALTQDLASAPGAGIACILVQRRYLPKSPSQVIFGHLPEQLQVQEEDLSFHLQLGQDQNTGFFMDMRLGRQWVRKHAAGKKVLNLFAYTCSLSVAALAGKAAEVVNVDMNKRMLELGRLNHQRNGLPLRSVRFLTYNVMKSIGTLAKRGPYDLVIVDPPSFQRGSFEAEKDYPRLVRRLPELLTSDGQVLACLNAPYLDWDFLASMFTGWRLHEQLAAPDDFPESGAPALKIALFSPGI